jgi:hypothetical protein
MLGSGELPPGKRILSKLCLGEAHEFVHGLESYAGSADHSLQLSLVRRSIGFFIER